MTELPTKWNDEAVKRGMAIIQILETAAVDGRRCPSSVEIAQIAGCHSDGVVTRLMRDLATSGYIDVVVCRGSWRVVKMLKGAHAGKSTAPHPSGEQNQQRKPHDTADAAIVMDALIQAVRDVMSVTVDDMRDKSRPSEAVQARNIVCWLGYYHFQLPATYIGKQLHRDHTTVILGANTAAGAARKDSSHRDLLLAVGARAADAMGRKRPQFHGGDDTKAPDNAPVAERVTETIRRYAERGMTLPNIKDFAGLVKSGLGNVRIILRRMIADGTTKVVTANGATFLELADGTRARVTMATLKTHTDDDRRAEQKPREPVPPMSPMAAPDIATIRRMANNSHPLPPARTCQWLEGEPKLREFCGNPSLPGSSYCAEHHARCWYKADRQHGKPALIVGSPHQPANAAAF